jgi:cytoskeletal protein RodZ
MNLSVGDIFIRERTKKNLTVQDVEKGTRIRKRYIEAIEQTKWDQFESKVYITGLIKSYARFLGVNEEKMIAYFRRDYEKQEDLHFKKKVEAKYFHPETRKFIGIAVVVIVLVFFSYFSYQMVQFLSPPAVTIISPDVQVFRGKERITVEAQTEPEAEVTIFDEQVFLDEEGRFTYDFPLQVGKNEFVIEVVGANGKMTTKEIEFILEE